MVDISNPWRSILTIPVSPRMAPTGGGISLIRNSAGVLTPVPSGKVPLAVIVTVLPAPGRITYLLPETLERPGADAFTLLSGIPGIETVIGLSTPRYTTFILSAAITAEFGFDIVENPKLTGIFVSFSFSRKIKFPSIL